MASFEEHRDALLAVFNAGGEVAYSRDQLPDLLPPEYIELSLSRRFGGTQRGSGETGDTLHRVVARAVAQTLDGAYRMWDRIEAVEYAVMVIGGVETTPLTFETDDDQIEPDAGWYSGSRSLAYALARAAA